MSLLHEHDRLAVGHALYDAGFVPSWSTDVMDTMIAGFGGFHKDGTFVYPLYLSNDEVQAWDYVKRMLRIEEKFENAQDVYAGFEDLLVQHGDCIKFEGARYYASTWDGGMQVDGARKILVTFISPCGTHQLQSDSGERALTVDEWNDFFVYDKVSVFERDV